jgi:hypothetical protein
MLASHMSEAKTGLTLENMVLNSADVSSLDTVVAAVTFECSPNIVLVSASSANMGVCARISICAENIMLDSAADSSPPSEKAAMFDTLSCAGSNPVAYAIISTI